MCYLMSVVPDTKILAKVSLKVEMSEPHQKLWSSKVMSKLTSLLLLGALMVRDKLSCFKVPESLPNMRQHFQQGTPKNLKQHLP